MKTKKEPQIRRIGFRRAKSYRRAQVSLVGQIISRSSLAELPFVPLAVVVVDARTGR